MVIYLLIGVALGVGSSIVPGPCGLAVIGAAVRHGRARAIATAVGAALGDATCASLGIIGTGRLLECHPVISPALQAISGVALIAYGTLYLRQPPACVAAQTAIHKGRAWRGVAVGFATLLANPAALVTWVLLVGSTLGTARGLAQGSAILGIALGTTAWFSGLGLVICRGATKSGLAVAQLTRAVCGLLIAYGTITLGRLISG